MFKKLNDEIIDNLETNQIKVCKYILWAVNIYAINKYLKEQYQRNKKEIVIIFIVDDYDKKIWSYKNQIIIRTSLNRSTMQFNEFVLPYIWECASVPFFPLSKTSLPIVGFCGLPSKYRINLIEKIKQTKKIENNFILRESFWAGDPHNIQVVSEFDENIKNSHFVICNRGNGNFSMRFYQTLAFGRIPLLLNTDTVLPFENIINYNDIIIMGNNENEIIQKILYWWKTKNIIEIQKKCAHVFETYFKTSNYAKHLHNEINKKIKINYANKTG